MKAVLSEIDANTLNGWLVEKSVLLVDIREPDEYAREHITGSVLVPLSRFPTINFVNEHGGKKVVFHCASGNRTAQAANDLLNTGVGEVHSLKNGIAGWKSAGYATHINKQAPISIMRQVQIVVGALMLLGIVLGLLVSPWLFGLSAMMGGGLLFAGFTGTCAMAGTLARLPYNRL